MNKKYRLPLAAFAAALFLKLFVFDIYQVNGDSMSPLLHSGNIVLIEKLSYKFSNPKAGDVVVIKNNDLIIKRIAAVENDSVSFINSSLYVNDKLKIENIPVAGNKTESIPRDYFFVLGDNKTLSIDSRSFGPIHKSSIKGRYILKLIP